MQILKKVNNFEEGTTTTTTKTTTRNKATITRFSSTDNQHELITSMPSKIAFSNFVNAIKSPETREKYNYTFLKIPNILV